VSAYGYARDTTPSLDALARRGVLFEHAFANSSWTLPSHASLLTGQLPPEHGADWLDAMRPDVLTLPEALAALGYRTAAFAANASYVAPEWGLGRGFARFDVYGASIAAAVSGTAHGRRLALNTLPRLGYFDIPGRKRASDVNREFLEWVDRGSSKPFFALLNYLDVHDPYLTTEPYQRRYSADPARGDRINFQFQPHRFRRTETLTPAEIRAELDAYDGCLAYLDARLGELFAAIADRDLDRNTVLIVTSDHGEAFGDHGLFGHGNSLYLEALRVPLIVRWTGRVPEGLRVGEPVGLERVAATVGDLLGQGPSRWSFPGASLAVSWNRPAGAGPSQVWPVLSDVTGQPHGPVGYPTTGRSLRSVITQDWHLIASSSGDMELFAWRTDPAEQVNLAQTAAGQAAIARLRPMLSDLVGEP
jgi:arylsulfatase A-like enzyme